MKNPTEPFKVALIGLGRMGSSYDGGQMAALPRSHVGAILANSVLSLVAVCDTTAEARAGFVADWALQVPVFDSVEQLFAHAHYDVVVVATDTSTHVQILTACTQAVPRIVFCEKPFCADAATATQLAHQLSDKGIQVSVNYHRRWDERFSCLREMLQQSGPVRHVELLYMKGLRNYGAHAIDLLQFLFGAVQAVSPLSRPTTRTLERGDPSYSAILSFSDSVQVNMIGFDDIDYELLDLDIVTHTARFNVEIGGHAISVRRFEEDLYFNGYANLSAAKPVCETSPVHGLTQAYEEFIQFLREGTPVTTSSADNAVSVHRVMDAIVQMARSGEGVVL